MNKQELRDEFESTCSYRKEDGFEYVLRFEYFKKGYSLAQETIKSKNDLIEMYHQEILGYTKTIEKQKKEIETLDSIIKYQLYQLKAKDAEIESLKGAYSIVADANTEKLFELEKKDQAIAEARELITYFKGITTSIKMDYEAKAWLEENK